MMVHSSLQPGRHVYYCSRTPGETTMTMPRASCQAGMTCFSQIALLVSQDERTKCLSAGHATCFLHVDDDSSAVVRPSTGVGKVHQAVRSLLWRSLCQASLEIGLGNRTPQPVRAKEIPVASAQLVRHNINLDPRRSPERPGQDVPFADVPRIGGVQQSLAYHVRRHGMVLRQLSQYIASKAVAPAVTDVADIRTFCVRHQRHQRRTHARQFLRRKRQAVDDRVRFMNGEPQTLSGVFGRQLPRAPCRNKGLHGRTRSDFSCLCSAETLANDIAGALTPDLLAFLNDGKAVLIGMTLQSDVCPSSPGDSHSHLLTLSIFFPGGDGKLVRFLPNELRHRGMLVPDAHNQPNSGNTKRPIASKAFVFAMSEFALRHI